MFDFHEKRKLRGLLYSKFSIGMLLVLALLLSFSVYERFTVEREMAGRLEEKRAELVMLKQRAASLESEVGHLQNERGIEEELRKRFDVVKEGEQVVVIVEDADAAGDLEALSVPPGGQESEERRWYDFLIFW